MKMSDLVLECPACGAQITVPTKAEVQGQSLVVTTDTADVWAHAWTHTEEG